MNQPVLIIGAGPVGMTLASELTRYGISVRIVDKAMQRTDKSKAMVLWSRTLELLDRFGHNGAEPFINAGFKIDGVTFVTGNKTIGRVAMDCIPSAHAYALTLPQSETERLLEERLGGRESVSSAEPKRQRSRLIRMAWMWCCGTPMGRRKRFVRSG